MDRLLRPVLDLMWRPWYRWSNLRALSERYGVDESPPGIRFEGVTVQIDRIRWRRVTTLVLSTHGLYIKVGTAPGALVPWEEIRDAGDTRLFLLPARALALGEPSLLTLRVYESMYRTIHPYLSTVARR